MRRKIFAVSAIAAAVLTLSTGPAQALPIFPGAGYGVGNLTSGMTTTFHIPKAQCARHENSTAIIGVISPAIGLLEGWNATAVFGCSLGKEWYRIQTWVNAVGGGWSTYPAAAGDLVEARVMYASTHSPLLQVTDWTTLHRVEFRMKVPALVAAAGAYAGAMVPSFGHANMAVWANHKELANLPRARRILWRGQTMLMAPGYAWPDGQHYSLWFRHH